MRQYEWGASRPQVVHQCLPPQFLAEISAPVHATVAAHACTLCMHMSLSDPQVVAAITRARGGGTASLHG